MNFEWHSAKAESNLKKHGVSFEEAATVFDDPMHLTLRDKRHSILEERYTSIGKSERGRILTISYIEEEDDLIRLISARQSTRRERKAYEEEY